MLLGMIDIGMLLLKILAVAGGASVGGLGAGVFLKLMVRWTIRQTAPLRMIRVSQVLGGGLLGWAVWIWAFGSGGSGFGWGGGIGGLGQGTGEQPVNSLVSETPLSDMEPPQSKHSQSAPKMVRVDMLGGNQVQAQRFYSLEGDTLPHTLAELGARILEMRSQATLKGIEIVIHPMSVAQEHPAVRDLEKWARKNDLTVSLSFPLEE